MRFLLYLVFIPLIIFNLYLGSYSVTHGEVKFINDVGRDFLLLNELDEKKIVLIGPRSSTNGLFHGPLLTYLDYPAYLAGGGNPVTVALFWVMLGIGTVLGGFLVARKLFGGVPALFYALLISVKMAPHLNSVFEPEAMYFVMPFFLFSIFKYYQTRKSSYLILHLVTVAILVQLSIGIGIVFLILSVFAALYKIVKTRNWKQIFSLIVIPIFTANFIIFDLRHSFMMSKALLFTGGSSKFFVSVEDWISNRILNTIHMQLHERSDLYMPLLAFAFIFILLFSFIGIKKNKKERYIYVLFIFYYFGYMVLSYFNKGILLFHYVYLLIPFSCLWLVSLIRGKYKSIFIVLAVIIYLLNLQYSIDYKNSLDSFMGNSQFSWKGLSTVADFVISQQKGKEFGYFVFSPDAFAYEPRYAMFYKFKNKNAHEYEKLDTTYVIAEGAPKNDPLMDYRWWVRVPVGITKKPELIKKFPNGYTVLKYNLSENEQSIPHDKSIELGIHFR